MPAYEHKILRFKGDMEVARKLDELTATGWEVVSVQQASTTDVSPATLLVVARKPA